MANITYFWQLNCTIHGWLDGHTYPALTTTNDTPPAAVCPINGGDPVTAGSLRLMDTGGDTIVNDPIISGTLNASDGRVIVPQGTAFPTDPAPIAGDQFYRTDTTTLYIYDGSGWEVSGLGTDHADLTNVTSDQHHAQLHAAAHADGQPDELTAEALATASSDTSASLKPDGAGGVEFVDTDHTDLTGVTANQHHAQTHAAAHSDGGADEVKAEDLALTSVDTSNVLRPDGAGGVQVADLPHSDVSGVSADQHHNQSHVLATNTALGPDQTVTGASAGDVLRASGAAAANFQPLGHGDLNGVTSDQHHAQSHAIGGGDHSTDTLANLNSKITDANMDDSGDSRTPLAHAASHSDGGTDEMSAENLATAGGTGTVPVSNGIGALAMGDHGNIGGLGDDDHIQYSKADGTRAFTGVVAGITPSAVADLATKGYVDSVASGATWQAPVEDKDVTDPSTLTPSTGERWIVGDSAIGVWAGHDRKIAEWNGSSWDLFVPNEGVAVWVLDENKQYIYNGAHPSGVWVLFGSTLSHDALLDVSADDHHNQSHVLASNTALGPDQTINGASAGDVLRASGAAAANFQPLGHGDLGSVTSDQHHAQAHAASHADGQVDELSAEALATASSDVSTSLKPDGAGGVEFVDSDHADLANVTSDQHHAQTHASAHEDGGADEMTAENMATAASDTSLALKPAGGGTVAFAAVTKGDVGLGNVENLKVNLVAVTAPTVNDDTGSGYAVGSRWIDVTADKEYVCVDATGAAAVWWETSYTGQEMVVLNSAQESTGSSVFAPLMTFKINLRKAFPRGLVFQIDSWISAGGSTQGEYRLYNVTDVAALVTLNNGVGVSAPAIYESSTVAATSIPNAVKEYALEHRRNVGAGAQASLLRGSILRRP